jgi:hypothetical protein
MNIHQVGAERQSVAVACHGDRGALIFEGLTAHPSDSVTGLA